MESQVEVTPLETNGTQLTLQHTAEDSFEASLAEGCFSVKVACESYETEARSLLGGFVNITSMLPSKRDD